MKKTILTFSLLVLMASYSTGFAQGQNIEQKREQSANLNPKDIAKKKTDQMTKSLGLDKSQEKAMYDINLKHAEEQAKLKSERQALKAKYNAEKKSHQSNIDQVLTEEQKAKLAAMKAKRVEKKKIQKHSHPPMPPKPSMPPKE